MNQPTEPTADLRLWASTLWQMFVALTSQGFSEKQALTVIAEMISGGFKSGGGTADE